MREDRNCQWRIARRPRGNVQPEDFEYREQPIPEPGEGEVLLRTLYLNLAPVMRMYMSGAPVAGEKPLDIGDVIHGRGVAEVVRSRHPGFREGEIYQGQIGWQTWKLSRGAPEERLYRMQDRGLSYSLGVSALGMTGFSAYCGFFGFGAPRPGDEVVVSGAAGGVGSIVTQIARAIGCRVTGIAGGPEKCRFVRSIGAAACIDYKAGDVESRLREACPGGIDLYFDNVGGEILSACLEHLAFGARIVLCGSISEYTREQPWGLTNYTRLRAVNGRMSGFFVYRCEEMFAEAEERLAGWITEGRLRVHEHIYDGFRRMPEGLAGLYQGSNTGIALCRVRRGPYDDAD